MNTPPDNSPLVMTQGEDKTFVVFVVKNGALFDATGCKVYFTVKKSWKDTATVVAKKNAAAGGADGQILIIVPQTGSSLGRIEVYVAAADTAPLDPDITYVCDCWLVDTQNKRAQITSMRDFVLLPRVTVVP